MPFNGSGGFTRVRNWVADAAAKIKIKSDFHDQEDDNFASGLSNTICKDGQTTVTADIPWNGKKLTNVANPTNPQDAATKGYVDTSIANGTIKTITQTVITTSGTYTKSAGLKFLMVEGVGPGGGGGGAGITGAGQVAAGSGGGGGGWSSRLFTAAELGASVAMTIGAAGNGGTGPNPGTAGGTTSFGAFMTLNGGGGGTGTAAAAGNAFASGGNGTAASGGTFNSQGNDGFAGIFLGPATALGGQGAGSPYGSGGRVVVNTNGGNARGYGSGGGGGSRSPSNGAQATGGDGSAGMLLLTEYF